MQIDSKRVGAAKPGSSVIRFHTRFHSDAFGYEVDLAGKGWTNWMTMHAEMPGAEFGAKHGRTGATMIVFPVPMPGQQPNLESLSKALLSRLGLEYPGNSIMSAAPCEVGPLIGQRICAQQILDGTMYQYDLRIVADERAAYLVGGWVAADKAAHTKVLTDALDRVRVTTRDLPKDHEMRPLQAPIIGLTLNEIGVAEYARGDLAAAIDFFASAGEHFPWNDQFVMNHLQALSESDRATEAVLILQQREISRPSSVELRAIKAKLLCQQSEFDAARKEYTKLFAEGYADETALLQYLAVALEAKAFDEAIAAVEAVAERRPTLEIARCCAGLYALKGDFGTAIDMLQKLRSRCPTDRGLAFDLARVYIQAEKFAEAFELTQQLLADGAQEEELLIVHGQLQMRLDRFADAKQTFEQTLTLYPASEEASELIKLASNQLGQGDNSSLKTPIAEVDIPPVVHQAIERATGEPLTESDDCAAEEMLRVTGVYYKPGEPLRRTTTRRIKVLTSGGVSRFSTVTFPYNPATERVFINRLLVRDEHGKQVAEGSVDNYYVVDDISSGFATNKQVVNLPVPGLKPGYTVECAITREDRFSSNAFPFQEVVLSSNIPVGVCAFFVQGDVKKLEWAASLATEVTVDGDALYCVQRHPAQYQSESNQPSQDSFLSIVWVGDSSASWAGVAEDYLASIDDKLVSDEQTQALASELTQNCHTSREKLEAIVAHVQQAYTYRAIEFGRRGQIPNSPARTLQFKYGDCKDHSVLTKQLLECAGISSHLALMKSTGNPQHDLPAIDQFNHMVLYVPSDAVDDPDATEGFVIDATEKDADALLTPPFGMGDKTVFVLDPADVRFVRIPNYPDDAGQFVCNREVTLRVDDAGIVVADVVEEVTFNAYLAPGIRAFLKHFEPSDRREAIEDLLSKNGQMRVKRVDVRNLDEPAEPLGLTIEYVMPDVFHPLVSSANEKSLVGQLPCPWEKQFLHTEYLEARETPFEIAVPIVVRSTLTVHSPPGFELIGLDRTVGSGQTKFVTWQCRACETGNTVDMVYEFRLAAGRHPAKDYEQYYAAMKRSLTTLQTPVTLREGTVETAQRPNAAGQSQ